MTVIDTRWQFSLRAVCSPCHERRGQRAKNARAGIDTGSQQLLVGQVIPDVGIQGIGCSIVGCWLIWRGLDDNSKWV